LDQFNIPQWPIGLILGVDWFMNMGRSCVNVMGNCLAAVLMAKIEGEFRTDKDWLSKQGNIEESNIDIIEDGIERKVFAETKHNI
jgi:proton glutamate symport protein